MTDEAIHLITKGKNRKLLYHFTRVSNLASIAHYDALWSSLKINPRSTGDRRLAPLAVKDFQYSITINTHLRISDGMLDSETTQEGFRLCLDKHVFFWPTLRDCQKMMDTYARREPEEGFAVLTFDAYSLITEHASAVKLTKYDSGSSPRFPHRCFYRKSPEMFLPLASFRVKVNHTVPSKVSEIKEILVEDEVSNVSTFLRSIYVKECETVPKCWRDLVKSIDDLNK